MMNWRSARRTRLIALFSLDDANFFRFRDATIFEKSSSPCWRACCEGPQQHARPESSDNITRPPHPKNVKRCQKKQNECV